MTVFCKETPGSTVYNIGINISYLQHLFHLGRKKALSGFCRFCMLHQLTYRFPDQSGAFVEGQRFWIAAN